MTLPARYPIEPHYPWWAVAKGRLLLLGQIALVLVGVAWGTVLDTVLRVGVKAGLVR